MKKWYEKTAIIILFLIFLFPVGLFLMWKYTNWTPKTKKVITAIICIVAILSSITNKPEDKTPVDSKNIADASNSTKTSTEKATASNTKSNTKALEDSPNVPNAAIVQVDDSSTDSTIIKDLHVIVEEPASLNDDNFPALCRKIVTEYTNSTKVNALTLYFYNNDNEIGQDYTLGMCTYYPEGSIEKAQNVKSGDYSTFKYTYTLGPKATTDVSLPNYSIKSVDDSSYGSIIRKDLQIVVEYSPTLNKDTFTALCKKIVTDYTSSTSVNALTLYFYENEYEIGSGYTVGMCTYYPDGDIGKAQDVSAGDYSTFKYTYTFNERNDENKPSDLELEIYDYYQSILNADYNYPEPSTQELTDMFGESIIPSDPSYQSYLQVYYSTKHEENCDKKTAEKYGITIDEVNSIWLKVNAYKNPIY